MADDQLFDEYDHYNFDKVHSGSSGKGRSKKEVADNKRPDPNADVRKTVTQIKNSEKKEKEKELAKLSKASQSSKASSRE
ncbi:uncharacterized protein LOC100371040 [Saccoglossus kowalevskii]|uniref:Uncharacterized protein LOC100371040 n=1 Tax=Saccoglossus kowalevskii TaxID=10224 RepID=A0ABM0H1J2_SACKO|nr:PREDICTED: uncharacterized protein LOC100371040 [Saccoglossus kowalevskii]